MRLRHLQSTRWVVRLLTVQVALVGWLRQGFIGQHRWAWAGLVGLTVLDVGLLLASGPVWAVAGHAVLVGLLLHPDAREWVRPGP